MHVYLINDSNKNFKFNGKRYVTPCTIMVPSIQQIEHLNQILKQNNIVDVKVHKREIMRSNKTIRKLPISQTTSKVALSTSIKPSPLSR